MRISNRASPLLSTCPALLLDVLYISLPATDVIFSAVTEKVVYFKWFLATRCRGFTGGARFDGLCPMIHGYTLTPLLSSEIFSFPLLAGFSS